jgi:hypothetical protein
MTHTDMPLTTGPALADPPRSRATEAFRRITRVVDPLTVPMSGRRFFKLWGVLEHRGRKSGQVHSAPIVSLRTRDGSGFIIPLPFGPGVNWARNVLAAGGGFLRWNGRRYALTNPEVIDWETARPAFGFVTSLGARGMSAFMRVTAVPVEEG